MGDHEYLDKILEKQKNGTLTELDKDYLLMSTDAAGQRKLCALWNREFPGDPK